MSTYVVSTYVDGTEGYRVWSDGYCEQWGQVTANKSGVEVTLLKPYPDTNYNAQATPTNYSTPQYTASVGTGIVSKTESSITLGSYYGSSSITNVMDYYTFGYIN
jgi:hypothetical protein